jgi:hypothetical protein
MSETQPANNVTFECLYQDGIIALEPRIGGASLSTTVVDARIVLPLVLRGGVAEGNITRGNIISLLFRLEAEGIIESQRLNWVGWSKIGESSFVLDITNDAGFRPMDWSGQVYSIKQLGRGAVVYGDNGITLMAPAQATFSFHNLALLGLLSKDAVCGTDDIHYLIDKKYQLWKLTTEGLTYLDFSEHLRILVDPLLHYDVFTKHVLISDDENGFILVADKLGSGYAKLSGYVYNSGELQISSPSLIEYAPLSFTTDILDFGRRSQKTITNVQVGTDVSEWLEIAYDYRFDIKEVFRCTHWVRLNKEATAYLACAGIEFRIKVRSRHIAACDVDYLNISFKTTDQRFSRSALVRNLETSAFAGSVTRDTTTTTGPNQ